MKKGELQAKIILEKFGIQFDDEYSDDNCGCSMPDLKYKDGRYLEVTHTRHNNAIYSEEKEYYKKSIKDQLEKAQTVSEAIDRIYYFDYEKSDLKLTKDGLKQYKHDCKLLKEHLGYDITSIEEPFSEFKCDIPIIQFSADNVIREVLKDKGEKYPDGNVDLFIFVTEEEYEYFFRIFNEMYLNEYANTCFKVLLDSPFLVIYVCIWDIIWQKYELEMPVVRKLEKTIDGGIRITTLDRV